MTDTDDKPADDNLSTIQLKMQAFAKDPDYEKYLKARSAGSVSKLNVIDDTDAAGAIPYLPKG